MSLALRDKVRTLLLCRVRLVCNHWQRISRLHFTPILILNDDGLLSIFRLCRPVLLDEEEVSDDRIWEGGDWGRERRWYKLTPICRRWQFLVLGSASFLSLVWDASSRKKIWASDTL